MGRILRLVIAAGLFASLLITGSAFAATAAPVDDGSTSANVAVAAPSDLDAASCCRLFKNQETNLWLDDSFEYGLRTLQYNGSDFQKWTITHWADNTWELKNLATGRCVDDSVAYGLRPFSCNKSKYQSWFFHNWTDGTTEIKNQITDRCLDNYVALRTTQCTTERAQSWF
ncbi:MAG TPA: RICIN domain-containing protein [Umezawaea sp.]|nr:RICIN domain-containing protein [Umezawaea sp.]